MLDVLAARVGLGELLKSGCTTSANHFDLFPRHSAPALLDHAIHGASEIGIRFYALRGCMSLGKSQGHCPRLRCLVRRDRIDLAGGLFNDATLPILCGSGQVVDTVVVGRQIRVRHGRLVGIDEEALAHQAAQASRELLDRARTVG
jgi:hypothetical protein